MKRLLSDLQQTTRETLERIGADPVVVPPAWAEHHGTLREQPAVIYGYAWQTTVLRWFRLSVLQSGESARVFSALALPRVQYDLPLFGAEIVIIKEAITVVALDWMPLFAGSPHLGGLPAIRRRYDTFPPGGDLPPWAAEAFSAHALFSRPRDAVSPSQVLQAYADYLEGYLRLCAAATPRGEPHETLAAQAHYCQAHFANDPGANMLANIFGAQWSQAYAREFLFKLPPDGGA